MLDAARKIIVIPNKHMPVISGLANDHIHISDVDYIVESDTPLPTMPNRNPGDIDIKIAEHIFPYLRDGMTLQLGIGGMPNALGSLIAPIRFERLGHAH